MRTWTEHFAGPSVILFFSLCLASAAQAGTSFSLNDLRSIAQKKQQEAIEKCEETTREKIQVKNSQYLNKMDAQQKEICTEELVIQEQKLCEEKVSLFRDQLAVLSDSGLKTVLNGRNLSREAAGQQIQAELNARVEKARKNLTLFIAQAFEKTRCDALAGLTGVFAKRSLLKKLGEKSDAILKDQTQLPLVLD
jgi:hypothetical protein